MRFALLAGALLLTAVLSACGGDSSGGAIPGIASAKSTRDVSDGAPGLTSTIVVRFDRPLEFAPRKVPLSSMFELSVPDIADETAPARRVFIEEATTAKDDTRTVTLSVKTLIPDGTELRVAKRAFQAKAEGDITTVVESDLAPLQALLASVELGLTRQETIAGNRTPIPTAADRDPAAVRELLRGHLRDRGASADGQATVIARYDAISVDLVPAPKARAALAGLMGTFAEPAIDWLLTSANCTGKPVRRIVFEQPPDNPGLFAQVTHASDGSRIVRISPALEGEPIERLIPILAHEAIHCDKEASKLEEIVATAFDTYLYILLASIRPEIVGGGTPLTKDFNVDVIAMINSGRSIPESIGVLPSPGVRQAIPGTTSPHGSFADLVAAAYEGVPDRSPEEPLAQVYAARIASAAGAPAGPSFNLRYLDDLLGRSLDPRILTALIEALALAPAK